MTMTERLLEATKEIWDGYNKTPFVKGIADGSLDHEKFKYYMIQDYLYLLDYTKVFSIGTLGVFVSRNDIGRPGIQLREALADGLI